MPTLESLLAFERSIEFPIRWMVDHLFHSTDFGRADNLWGSTLASSSSHKTKICWYFLIDRVHDIQKARSVTSIVAEI